MKKMIYVLPILLNSLAFGQATTAIGEYSLQTLKEDLRLTKYNDFSTKKEEYFKTEFINAKVSGFKEKEKLRYNAFYDQFEFIRDGYLYKLDKLNNQVINFDNGDIYKYVTYLQDDNLVNRYLKVLTALEQKYILYKKFEIDATDALGTNGFTNTDSNGKRYSRQEKLVIGWDDTIYNMPNSVKKINQLLGVNVDEIVKKHNLNLKKEQDLIQLINMLNK